MREVALALFLLCGCDALPRDPAGTLNRIEQRGTFTVAALEASARSAPQAGNLISEIEKRTHARAQWRSGSGESVLQQLEEGKLDVVVGHFKADSP